MKRRLPLQTWCLSLTVIAGIAAGSPDVRAADWVQWRGPNHNGSTQASGLPVEFSKSKGVKWSVELPGPSPATPIVVGERVFVSSMQGPDHALMALALDRGTGKLLWKQQVGFGPPTDNRANKAGPSPVCDGERVIFFYGTGELAAFGLDGKKLWQKNITRDHGDFAFLWTFCTSPLLHKGKLYIQVLQRDTPVNGRGGTKGGGPIPSFILALDPATGDVLVKHLRPAGAVSESLEAFTTPIVHTRSDGSEEIVIVGGDCLTGHEPGTLKETWRWGTWNPKKIPHWRLVPSAVAGAGVILACAPKGDPIYAIRADLTGDRSGDPQAVAWTSAGNAAVSSDVVSPAFHDGKFYVVRGEGRDKFLSCVEGATGKVLWSGKLPGKHLFRASPTVADGKVYMIDYGGNVVVASAGPKFEILATAALGEDGDDLISATPVVSGKNLFFRTNSRLFCIGE